MADIATFAGEDVSPEAFAAVRRQIRGSGLLIAGRLLSAGLMLVSQVLIVRYLSTADYGAWAYALAFVVFWQTISNLGFQDAITRFVPIYKQQREYPKMFGTMLLSFGFVLLFSILVIGGVFAAPNKVLAFVRQEGSSLKILFVLIFLVPVEALDGLLMGLFASLASARAIFFRRYVLAPGLRVLVVVLLVTFHADVLFLAYGYVAAGAIGMVVYAFVFLRQLGREGLLASSRLRSIRFPAREIFSFALPMMTSDMLVALNESIVVLLLGYYRNMQDVAFFRVAVPIASVTQMVTVTAALLYMPAAARLFAGGDLKGLQYLYWRTAAWIAVFSFPIFTATFAFAKPVMALLYGERYADAGVILAIMSVGYFVNVVFGLNGVTVKAVNKIRYVVGYNVATALTNIAISLVLVPRYGAVGAAIGAAVTIVVYATLKQVALRWAAGISVFDRSCMWFYVVIALAVVSLVAIRWIASLNLYVATTLALISIVAVVLIARKELKIAEIFPETARIPLMRRFLA